MDESEVGIAERAAQTRLISTDDIGAGQEE
jgi:hypothetical protein